MRFGEKIRSLKGADYIVIIDDEGDDPTAYQRYLEQITEDILAFRKIREPHSRY